jgi:RNA polymerase sigma factor (sigma-70 family)
MVAAELWPKAPLVLAAIDRVLDDKRRNSRVVQPALKNEFSIEATWPLTDSSWDWRIYRWLLKGFTGMADTSVSLLERLCLHSDDVSWRRFVDLYRPLILNWLRRYSVKEEDAEDLAQEVLTVVVRELVHFQHNQKCGAFRSWLRTVTVNQLRELSRERRGQPATRGESDIARMLDQLEDANSSLSQLWDQQHDQHVARRLMELVQRDFEPTTWQAFQSVFLDGKKAATVAEELGLSVNSVLLAKSRVLNRLRQEARGLTN